MLSWFQSKIARLTKKFGAANQASENSKKAQEVGGTITTKSVDRCYFTFSLSQKTKNILETD